MYGIDLTTLLIMDGTKIPKVVRDCVHAVESRGESMQILYIYPNRNRAQIEAGARIEAGCQLCVSLIEAGARIEARIRIHTG